MSAKTSGTYEKDMEQLREITNRLSDGGITLDEMMKLYEKGVELCEKCRKTLDGYEAKLIAIGKETDERNE